MTIYDYIIVGAGLSGLYSAYNLLKENPDLNILILERNREIGGRIDTQDGFEAGAGRFHNNQPLINKLIRELGLEKHKVPINSYDHFITNKQIHDMGPIDETLQYIINRKENKETLKNIIFLDYVRQVLSDADATFLLKYYGYSLELTNMNAYDTINLINKGKKKNQFYKLKGGLSQIIGELTRRINAKILRKHRVIDINYNDKNQFEITCDNIQRKYISKKCICAVTKETLLKLDIFKPIYKVLRFIETLPLCRIYATFPSPNSNPWFEGMPPVTVNSHLRLMIPIDEKEGTIMMSYTDGKYARYWKQMLDEQGIDVLNREHQKLIKKATGIDVPTPQDTRVFYWEHGVAYFKPGFDSETMLKQIRKPFPEIPLFVCGENFSELNSQWMEGALDTTG